MARLHVAQDEPCGIEIVEKAPDPYSVNPGVISINHLIRLGSMRQIVRRQAAGDGVQWRSQLQSDLFLSHAGHEPDLVFHQKNVTFVDHSHPICDGFGLFELMSGQDDRDAIGLQISHHIPHVLPELDIDAHRRFIKKQNLRFMS